MESNFNIKDRKELVQIGKELCILSKDDIAFIMDTDNPEAAVRQRFTTARLRDKRR